MVLFADAAFDHPLVGVAEAIEGAFFADILLAFFLVGDEVHVDLLRDDGGGRIRARSVVVGHPELVKGLSSGHGLGNQLLFDLEGPDDLDFLLILVLDELGGDLVVADPFFRRLGQHHQIPLLDFVRPTAHGLRHREAFFLIQSRFEGLDVCDFPQFGQARR